ncbi:hypothetical protein RRSWK_02139 [Rhodopirellula sp. SWK7]|nr:hypothetical protein RRSWK_02139 [Rhodopirellula sp. SWK7]
MVGVCSYHEMNERLESGGWVSFFGSRVSWWLIAVALLADGRELSGVT